MLLHLWISMTKTKYKKYRTFHLPKVIVDYLLLRLKQNETDKPLEVEILLSIINEILTKTNQNRKYEDYPFHIHPLDSRYLKTKYGNDYVRHINWLCITSVIWNDSFYKGKTTYYMLNDFKYYYDYVLGYSNINVNFTYCFLENKEISIKTIEKQEFEENQKNRIYKEWYTIKIPITKKNSKYLTYQYEKDSTQINNAPKHIKKMGSHYRKTLEINKEEALAYSELYLDRQLEKANTKEEINSAYKRYSTRIASIESISNGKNNKTLRFTRNDTNKRIDTNLTNMASDLRPFIVGYENMAYLDLKNSQPVLFNILLEKHRKNASESLRKELNRFFDVTTTGSWYELLMELYRDTQGELSDEEFRNVCKKHWMEIAYSENSHYPETKAIFKREFPNIYNIIYQIKKSEHNKFAIALQKIESQIFIDEICRQLVAKGIIPFTMHDGLLIPKKHKEETLRVMSDVLKKHLGVVPVISPD